MKIKTIISLCLIIMMLPANAQKKRNILQHNIKTITEYNEDTENKGKQVKETYTSYDELGNITEEIEYESNGKIKKHSSYEYDEDSNKTKEIIYNAKGEKEKIIEYKYTEGLKTERITYSANGKVKSKKKYVYSYH